MQGHADLAEEGEGVAHECLDGAEVRGKARLVAWTAEREVKVFGEAGIAVEKPEGGSSLEHRPCEEFLGTQAGQDTFLQFLSEKRFRGNSCGHSAGFDFVPVQAGSPPH